MCAHPCNYVHVYVYVYTIDGFNFYNYLLLLFTICFIIFPDKLMPDEVTDGDIFCSICTGIAQLTSPGDDA